MERVVNHSSTPSWGFSPRGAVNVELGGSKGTPEEAKVGQAWPNYEAEYLKTRLDNPAGKYDIGTSKEVRDAAYLDKVTENYKEEADECLEREFRDWLQGKHMDNVKPQKYENGAGKPVRRWTDRYTTGDQGTIAEPMDTDKNAWFPTWWGDKQLTHLPGVRDYMRKAAIKSSQADEAMNILAEVGPQDLQSAWMYFKKKLVTTPGGGGFAGMSTLGSPRARGLRKPG